MFAPPVPVPALLLAPELVAKLRIALVISTTCVPVDLPSMVPMAEPSVPCMSAISALIVPCGLASPEFLPICDIAASTVPNLPASSFAALVVLILVGIVAIKSTLLIPKALATNAFLTPITSAMVLVLPLLEPAK